MNNRPRCDHILTMYCMPCRWRAVVGIFNCGANGAQETESTASIAFVVCSKFICYPNPLYHNKIT